MWLVTQEHIPTGRLFQLALQENARLGKLERGGSRSMDLRSLYENHGFTMICWTCYLLYLLELGLGVLF